MTRDRLEIEVCTAAGPAAVVEFRARMDTVEVTCNGALFGVFDRWVLRKWLLEPSGSLQIDEVVLWIDRMIDSLGRVTITLAGAHVHGWSLSPSDQTALLELV